MRFLKQGGRRWCHHRTYYVLLPPIETNYNNTVIVDGVFACQILQPCLTTFHTHIYVFVIVDSNVVAARLYNIRSIII